MPFIDQLSRDVTLSFIAHALVCGPASRAESHISEKQLKPHPLVRHKDGGEDAFRNSLLRWCSSFHAVIPADLWLYSLLQTNACFVFGGVGLGHSPRENWSDIFVDLQLYEHHAILPWNGFFAYNDGERLIENASFLATYFSELAINGFQALNQELFDMRMLVSSPQELELSLYITSELDYLDYDDQKTKWHVIPSPNAQIENLVFQTGIIKKPLPLDHIIEAMEHYRKQEKTNDLFYFAEIQTKQGNSLQPETLLAKIWNECLGPHPIPFDPEARSKLIEHGRKHPELRRHIEAWEEMKRTGSKWVVGDAEN